MRGHENVISMRRRGAMPSSVWFHDYGDRRHALPPSPWPTFGNRVDVDLFPDDFPRRLDLRFVVGLVVFVHAESRERLDAITAACVDAGAQRVLGVVFERVGTFHRVVDMTDSHAALEGVA